MILLGLKLLQVSIPIVVFTRKALGLLMLNVVKLSLPVFARVTERLRQTLIERRDARGSFWLGVAFSFAACPTLFVLFFSTMTPLALSSFGGIAFPAIFAIGTSMPLLLFVALVAFGTQSVTPFAKRLRSTEVWVSRIAAIVFILIGINKIILYWFI